MRLGIGGKAEDRRLCTGAGGVTGASNIVPDPEAPLELAAASVVVIWLVVRELKVGHQQKSRRIYQRDYLQQHRGSYLTWSAFLSDVGEH